jgi:threonine synthase
VGKFIVDLPNIETHLSFLNIASKSELADQIVMFWTASESVLTGKLYDRNKYRYYADDEGEFGLLSTKYDLKGIAASLPQSLRPIRDGMFRYMPFLPMDPSSEIPTLMVGATPLVPVSPTKSGFPFQIWVKDEGRNPTASLKDRSSALVCVKAKELGVKTISTASSGNAAAATSAMASDLGLSCVIFVPESAPKPKIIQNLVYGSKVYLVKGDYDKAVATCKSAAAKNGWYNRSTGFNQFTVDGKKTVSFEVCEEFASILSHSTERFNGQFAAPDVMVVPCGVGNILSGIHKGLVELLGTGLISKLPRLIAVQAEGSNSLYECWRDNAEPQEIKAMIPFTCVDSLSTGYPNDSIRAIRAVKETNGAFIEVTDDQILAALPEMAKKSGVYAEPAGASAWAGLKIAAEKGMIGDGESVVVVSTGNGLKDIHGVMRAVSGLNTPTVIESADEV